MDSEIDPAILSLEVIEQWNLEWEMLMDREFPDWRTRRDE